MIKRHQPTVEGESDKAGDNSGPMETIASGRRYRLPIEGGIEKGSWAREERLPKLRLREKEMVPVEKGHKKEKGRPVEK